MQQGPILLLASERSGTNLMRTRMNNHSKIAAPPPIHLFKNFYMNEIYYGDLTNDNNLDVLLNDIFDLNSTSIEPWEIKFNADDVKSRLNKKTFTDIFSVFFELYAESQNKEIWFCKENKLFEYAWKILQTIPGSRFIYLVRDPRDVFVSFKKRTSGEKTAFAFSQMWKHENSQCIRLLYEPLIKNRMLLVKYEDILQYPEETYKRICDFAGVEFEKEMLRGKKSRIKERIKDWENISKDIIKNNHNKFVKALKHREIKIIEANLNKEMSALNYQKLIKNNDFKFMAFRNRKVFLMLNEYMKRFLTHIIRKYIKSIYIKEIKEEYQIRSKRMAVISRIRNRNLLKTEQKQRENQ
ncbi:MAG: sulfotransferase [Bacteroidales bacterium]